MEISPFRNCGTASWLSASLRMGAGTSMQTTITLSGQQLSLPPGRGYLQSRFSYEKTPRAAQIHSSKPHKRKSRNLLEIAAYPLARISLSVQLCFWQSARFLFCFLTSPNERLNILCQLSV